ncbi:MAG: EcsC family protein [Acidimicrobiia bacterium]
MTDYERRAWERLRVLVAERTERTSKVPVKLHRVVERAGEKARGVWDKVPVADNLEEALLKALEGLKDLTLDPAMASVSEKGVINRFAKHGHAVKVISDIRNLDLEQLDRVMPKLRSRYSAVTALEGAAAGLIITGGEALAAVGSVFGAGVGAAPGAGAIAGAMAFDAATVIAASARVTAHVGTYYGYEVCNPEEELFALSSMSFSNSGPQTAKLMAFQQLSKVTQQLIRRKTWAELNEQLLVRVLTEMFKRLGLRVTQRKLGQAVPVVGIVIGAGLNASYLQTVGRDAELAYRMRFLAEKNDLDPSTLAPLPTLRDAAAAAGDFINIEEIVDAELVDEPGTETDGLEP